MQTLLLRYRRGVPPMMIRACVATALVVLALPASAPAARGMEVALQDDSLLVAQQPYPLTSSLPQLLDLEVSWVRMNVVWSDAVGSQADERVKPRRIAYDWGRYDNLVDNAAARGIQVEVTLTGPAPAWAEGRGHVGVYKPSVGLFKGFVKDAARHFAPRVTRYSIWNEPNHVSWLQPQSRAPRLYRALYEAGYRAVKHVDKDTEVLIGETAPYSIRGRATAPLAFIRGVTCVDARYRRHGCGPLRADGFAHHPYDFRHAPTYRYPGTGQRDPGHTWAARRGALQAARRPARAHADAPRQAIHLIYLTEYGYFSSGRGALTGAAPGCLPQRAFTIAQRNPHVRQMLQYLLVTPPRKYRFFDTSLIRRDGRSTRPFEALRHWATAAARDGRIITPRAP